MNKEEFISMSLPHGLKFKSILDEVQGMITPDIIWTCSGLTPLFGGLCLNTLENNDAYPISMCRPILHPLSDLTKSINGKAPLSQSSSREDQYILSDLASGKIDIMDVRFWMILTLVKLHFDIAGLIEKGEAIDINALPTNPYER